MSLLSVKEIAQMMADRAQEVASHLLPAGKLVGREWEVGSIGGEPGRSLKVHVSSGDKRGVWSDYATGQSGDMLDLWRVVRGHSSNKDALAEVKPFLGIKEQEFVRPKDKTFRKPEAPKAAKRIADAGPSPVMKYLTEERKLTLETISKYRVAEVDEIGPWENWKSQKPAKGPWVIFPYIRGGLVSMKYLHLQRKDGKKFTLVEPNCEPTCFGWDAMEPTSRVLTICEGEIDAMTLYQYGYPAVSVPFGGGKGDKQQWVNYDWDWLEPYETIYLCFDMDKAGEAAVEELVQRLGLHRCRIVSLPYKDANECIQKGVTKAKIDKCFAEARYIEPDELKRANYFTDDVIAEFYPSGGVLPGFDSPWEKVGFRFLRGEVSLITGTNGHGKSLMWGQMVLTGGEQGERSCVASLEMAAKKTLYRMVRQATGAKFPSKDEIGACLDWMSDKVWLFNLVGTGKVSRLLEVFEYAYRRFGIKQFVIDSLMKCGIAEDDYNGQKIFIERLCDFAARTGAHVHLIAHPRKGEDENRVPGKLDVKGTGAISDLAFNSFIVWRNKRKETILRASRNGEPVELPKGVTLEDVENEADATLTIDKSRNVEDVEGKYHLWFDQPSMQYMERKNMTPKVFFKTPEREVEEDAPF